MINIPPKEIAGPVIWKPWAGVWKPRKENADVRAQKSATREELLAAGG